MTAIFCFPEVEILYCGWWEDCSLSFSVGLGTLTFHYVFGNTKVKYRSCLERTVGDYEEGVQLKMMWSGVYCDRVASLQRFLILTGRQRRKFLLQLEWRECQVLVSRWEALIHRGSRLARKHGGMCTGGLRSDAFRGMTPWTLGAVITLTKLSGSSLCYNSPLVPWSLW